MLIRARAKKMAPPPRSHIPIRAAALDPPEERMSKVDTAWLHMDGSHNLTMIVGVLVLRPGLAYADLVNHVQQRLPCYPRFVQCAVEDASGARWVRDPEFHISNHLVLEKLPRRSPTKQQQALQDRLGVLCMQPLDRKHPLWQFHLVEHYQGGSALMLRIHHCMADSMAPMAVIQALVDGTSEPVPKPGKWPHPDSIEEWLLQGFLQPVTQQAVHTLEAAGDSAARALALALMPPDDSASRLKGQPGTHKRMAWCAPLPLAEVKAVGKALHCSVNDVLLSCVAGAMGAYLRSQGEEVKDKNIRTMVPVNLRPLEQASHLGNQFGLVPLLLPIGLDNPVERIYAVHQRMRVLQHSMQPMLTYSLLVLDLFAKKTTAIMSNVPGPANKLTLCGSTVDETLVWVPQTGSVGLGVSILSYGGGVQFGLMADATLCPEPQQLVDLFEPEFAKLCMLTLMLPWGEVG